MFTLEIAVGSLKISNEDKVILLYPKDSCAINTLALSQPIPTVEMFNKYLANNTELFREPLSLCKDSAGVTFTPSTFITFAQENLGN